jgi:hypothetical protein
MSFSTTPFKNYISEMHAGFLDARKVFKPKSPWASEAPCSMCSGQGYLQGHMQFSKLDDALNKFTFASGSPISAPVLVPCPSCLTLGEDKDKIIERLESEVA